MTNLPAHLQILKMQAETEPDVVQKAAKALAYAQALEKAQGDEAGSALGDPIWGDTTQEELDQLWRTYIANLQGTREALSALMDKAKEPGVFSRLERASAGLGEAARQVRNLAGAQAGSVETRAFKMSDADVRKAASGMQALVADVKLVKGSLRSAYDFLSRLMHDADAQGLGGLSAMVENWQKQVQELSSSMDYVQDMDKAQEPDDIQKAINALPISEIAKVEQFGRQLLAAAKKPDENMIGQIITNMRRLGQGLYDQIVGKLASFLRMGDLQGILGIANQLVTAGKAQGAEMAKTSPDTYGAYRILHRSMSDLSDIAVDLLNAEKYAPADDKAEYAAFHQTIETLIQQMDSLDEKWRGQLPEGLRLAQGDEMDKRQDGSNDIITGHIRYLKGQGYKFEPAPRENGSPCWFVTKPDGERVKMNGEDLAHEEYQLNGQRQ